MAEEMKKIIRKSVKISDEIADFINDRWNVQKEKRAIFNALREPMMKVFEKW